MGRAFNERLKELRTDMLLFKFLLKIDEESWVKAFEFNSSSEISKMKRLGFERKSQLRQATIEAETSLVFKI
jgi:predicted aldo/keto reductase-like oxidoreductase